MKIFQKYKTDEQAEVEGAWVPLSDGAKVKVARWKNERHSKILSELQSPYKEQLRAGIPLSDKLLIEISARSMAEAILLDWSGFEDDLGAELPYSVDNAFKLLSELKDFRDDIANIADSRATFNEYALQQAKKS